MHHMWKIEHTGKHIIEKKCLRRYLDRGDVAVASKAMNRPLIIAVFRMQCKLDARPVPRYYGNISNANFRYS